MKYLLLFCSLQRDMKTGKERHKDRELNVSYPFDHCSWMNLADNKEQVMGAKWGADNSNHTILKHDALEHGYKELKRRNSA